MSALLSAPDLQGLWGSSAEKSCSRLGCADSWILLWEATRVLVSVPITLLQFPCSL